MNNILTIGYIGEGTTDERFLAHIIKRTFEDLAFECKGQIEVYDPQYIKVNSSKFVDKVVDAATHGKWLHVLCVHTDADSENDTMSFQNKINPAFENIEQAQGDLCRNIVPIVPVHMTEAWMLADVATLIDEIGTNKAASDLGLPTKINQVESDSDPKRTIVDAIRLAFENVPTRRRISIADLYSPISQNVSLQTLNMLPSYAKFRIAARQALVNLNYM